MKVKVKEGKTGFIYGSLRTEGQEFTLKPVKHSVTGKTITVKEQFSDVWMESLETKKPRAVKPVKSVEETEEPVKED